MADTGGVAAAFMEPLPLPLPEERREGAKCAAPASQEAARPSAATSLLLLLSWLWLVEPTAAGGACSLAPTAAASLGNRMGESALRPVLRMLCRSCCLVCWKLLPAAAGVALLLLLLPGARSLPEHAPLLQGCGWALPQR